MLSGDTITPTFLGEPRTLPVVPVGEIYRHRGSDETEGRFDEEARRASQRARQFLPQARLSRDRPDDTLARRDADQPDAGAHDRARRFVPSTQFMVQVIAQEVIPRDSREEPGFAAGGSAAYLATASRGATLLGPVGSVHLLV